MVALGIYRSDLHSCGQPLSEAAAAESMGQYAVPAPLRCHACTAIDAKQAEYSANPAGQYPHALLWRAERKT